MDNGIASIDNNTQAIQDTQAAIAEYQVELAAAQRQLSFRPESLRRKLQVWFYEQEMRELRRRMLDLERQQRPIAGSFGHAEGLVSASF